VIGGQINVLLGSLVSLDDPKGTQNPADAVRFDEPLKPRFLGIKIGADGNQEMVPRHQLVPSFHARIADTTVDGGVGTAQIEDGAVTFPKLDTDALAAIIPPGMIVPYGGTTAPPGWVLCDGSQYEGTDPQFENLFAAIGTSFGGDGTSFNVPDLRGQFLRGLDPSGSVDPDGASRTVGSTQGTAIVGLAGQVIPSQNSTNVGGEHDHRTTNSNTNQGPFNDFAFDLNIRSNSSAQFTFPSGTHQHTIDIPASAVNVFPTSGATSTETRPKNVAVNYIVKL
jgi:microcystin-dependent protein